MKKIKMTKWQAVPLLKTLPKQKDHAIWAIATQKGGVGKTTFSSNFSEALNQASKRNTLIANCDLQSNIIDTALVRDGEGAIISTDKYITTMDLFDLCVDDDDNIVPSPLVMNKELYRNKRGIYLIPSNKDFLKVDRLDDDLGQIAAPLINLNYLAETYDLANTILDCMPHLGFGVKASLFVSDYVVSPVEPHDYSVSGLAAIAYALREANLMRRDVELPSVKFIGAVVNRFDSGSAKARSEVESLRDQLGDAVLASEIQERNPIKDASGVGLPVWENKKGGSPVAATEILNAINEVVQRGSDMYVSDNDPHDEVAIMLADYYESNQN